ncbi:hypothetical protein H1Z61_17165 [Bacillus aquiflavi]|uniref:Uncharacterized protein n=1 Tax=Bacillus aquiflavi TaxID=2672567 RepID=A0A6B3W5Z4_9BACI|nr:hypothetical protein [Bacillus aquiflavi]MBA4538807.1 hypothetical protein [Bacillus aquiflavi]NEY83161.1 hypothetical protein [Bacillus aquiflavi]UAC49285.1 hypothetical protein K6959_05315 [Bacillus aquiflavi]
MKVRCICGNLMEDEKLDTCNAYSIYLDEDYDTLLEKEPKTVEEFVDNMPLSGSLWECKQCGRLHFFKKGKIDVYKLEQEILD